MEETKKRDGIKDSWRGEMFIWKLQAITKGPSKRKGHLSVVQALLTIKYILNVFQHIEP